MAEVKNEGEEQHSQAMPAKRKPDLASVDEQKHENDDSKKQKIESSSDKIPAATVAEDQKIDNEDDDEDEEEDYEDKDDDEDEDENEDEDEDEEDDDGDEHSNGRGEIDRKGKGILREDKGKGKLVEESDDSSDGGNESDGDSTDLSDDPLAEVDLDNILPSRTRRRVVQPGVYISNDIRGNDDSDGSDDGDS